MGEQQPCLCKHRSNKSSIFFFPWQWSKSWTLYHHCEEPWLLVAVWWWHCRGRCAFTEWKHCCVGSITLQLCERFIFMSQISSCTCETISVKPMHRRILNISEVRFITYPLLQRWCMYREGQTNAMAVLTAKMQLRYRVVYSCSGSNTAVVLIKIWSAHILDHLLGSSLLITCFLIVAFHCCI